MVFRNRMTLVNSWRIVINSVSIFKSVNADVRLHYLTQKKLNKVRTCEFNHQVLVVGIQVWFAVVTSLNAFFSLPNTMKTLNEHVFVL